MMTTDTNFRRNIVAGNWKSNKFIDEGKEFVLALQSLSLEAAGAEVWIAPPLTSLPVLSRLEQVGRTVQWAAQQCSAYPSGAHTGECTAEMISDAGAQAVIIGHSERRERMGETDAVVAIKVKRAWEAGLTVIFCCGEDADERQTGTHIEKVLRQLELGVLSQDRPDVNRLIVAYEPIWAIGTGLTALPEQAQEMHAVLRSGLAAAWGEEVARGIPILYGGSCNPSNAEEIFGQPDVDGGLIGGASLQPETFFQLIVAADREWQLRNRKG
jgi:triosephosphate isomerase